MPARGAPRVLVSNCSTCTQGAIEGLVQLAQEEQSNTVGYVQTCCEWCGAALMHVGSAWGRPMTLSDLVASTNMVFQRLQPTNGLQGLLPAEELLLCPVCAPTMKAAVRTAAESCNQ